jgi:glycosyltransferase involved in cell wall biosynthesis
VELHVHAPEPGLQEPAYVARLLASIERDVRVVHGGQLAPGEVQARMHDCDVVAVPSQWLETGPLVVKEALVVGTPVLGSNLGGIAELVQHGRNGWLVDPADPRAWALEIQRLSNRRPTRTPSPPSRELVPSVLETAKTMIELYDAAL